MTESETLPPVEQDRIVSTSAFWSQVRDATSCRRPYALASPTFAAVLDDGTELLYLRETQPVHVC